jgi:hypothetical protein
MRLSYDGLSVSGTATRVDPVKGSRTEQVAAQLPVDVVDQRIDWAALMSAPLTPHGTVSFAVYDPWTGTSPLSAQVGETEQVRVPAGTFDALAVVYRIAKRSRGSEQYKVWLSVEVPRFLVREDFPDGATSELVRFRAPPPS